MNWTISIFFSHRKISLNSLHKEKVAAEDVVEDRVKGFLLKGKFTVGNISLPGFYRDWEDSRGLIGIMQRKNLQMNICRTTVDIFNQIILLYFCCPVSLRGITNAGHKFGM